MKIKILFGISVISAMLLLIAASTTEVNISTLPSATTIVSSNAVLVLTNATKARLATVQQILNVLNTQSNLNVTLSNITAKSYLLNGDNGSTFFVIKGGSGVPTFGIQSTNGSYLDAFYNADGTPVLEGIVDNQFLPGFLFDPSVSDGFVAPFILNSKSLTNAPLLNLYNASTLVATIDSSGKLTLSGTTNQVTFGATNTAPVSAGAAAKWISVQVSGFTNAYRIPLYE